MNERKLSTKLIHTGDGKSVKRLTETGSIPEVFPLYMTSVFSFDDVAPVDAIYEKESEGYLYSRMRHPNTDVTAEILAKADGGEMGLVFSSGMAAITLSILAFVKPGDHIVSSPVLYGGVHDYFSNELQRLGIEVTFVDFLKEDITGYIKPNTRIIYTETISNPLMEVPDLKKIADTAHRHNALFFIDNTFATPAVCRPMDFGADAVLYSATKYLGGHSDIVGGAVVGAKAVIETIRRCQVLYGAVLGPMDSWLLARSLRTLELRMAKHSENALKIAEYLEKHPKVLRVYYPGLASSQSHEMACTQFVQGRCGGMLSFDIDGGEKEVTRMMNAFETIQFVPSLAGTATTLSYAVKTSHRAYSPEELDKAGITPGQIRLSVGLEDGDDIMAELERTFQLL